MPEVWPAFLFAVCRDRVRLENWRGLFGLRGKAVTVIPPPLDAHDVKQRADFVAIASRYTRLRRAGRQYVGLCPFHSERHPSFYVEPERKLYQCFGCGKGGDVFDFIIRAEHCDFLRALEIAASAPGVARESELRSSERFRAGVGAKPLGPRSGPAHIARKPEPSRFVNALRDAEGELPGGCEAERAVLYSSTSR